MANSNFFPTNELELSKLKKACQISADALLLVGEKIKPGISTDEINTIVHNFITSNDAYPSPLNYKGFPKSVCTSKNEIACHGIPSSEEILLDGDIVNVDVTAYFPTVDGFHGDTSAMFYIGNVAEDTKTLVETTRIALSKGIEVAQPGLPIGIIGNVIQTYIESKGFSIAKDFVGHGIGKIFHGFPSVLHHKNSDAEPIMKPGMVFTIEPIINKGRSECVILSDGWTVCTRDKSLSAQFEHTILITENGNEILTQRKERLKNSEI